MTKWRGLGLVCALAVLALSSAADGDRLRLRLDLTLETSVFEPDEQGSTNDDMVAVAGRLEANLTEDSWRGAARVFARYDALHGENSTLIPEEAYVGIDGAVQLLIGYQLLDWTATTVFHPADVVNSRNLNTGLDDVQKQGEPMVTVGVPFARGQISVHYMPMRIDPMYPGATSRYAPQPGAELGKPLWLGWDGMLSEQRFEHQWAARVSRTFRGADLGLHVVQHSDRHQPVFVVDPATMQPRPLLYSVTQVGASFVRVSGPWALRSEVAHRSFAEARPPVAEMVPALPEHTQVAAGVEYGWGGVNDDSVLLLEMHSLVGLSEKERALSHLFQRDVLVGYRKSFTEGSGREFSAVLIFDLERSNEYLGSLRYRQRIGDDWSGEGSVRFVYAPQKADQPRGLEPYNGMNQLQLQLTRHF
jgi:hypothetical protein